MKIFLRILTALLFFSVNNSLFPQYSDNQDYRNFNSVLQNPPLYTVSPPGTNSTVVTTNGFDNFYLGVDFGEPYIATNPRDPLNSICAFNINNYYYTLNGHDWTKIVVSFTGFGVIGDPVVAFDSIGTAYYVQLYQNGPTYGVVVIKSTNKGVTWISPSSVYSTNVGLSDKEWITADQTGGPFSNYIYVGWRQFGASGMRLSRSTNFGATWSAPLSFSGSQGAYVSVGANGPVQGGCVYFAYYTNAAITFNKSTDGGATFSSDMNAVVNIVPPGVDCGGRNTVKGCIRTDPFPRMAADNSFTSSRGNVYIVYAANPPGSDIADVYLVRSTDLGNTWTTPVRINDDATTTDQWMPAINVDNTTGKVFICWYDSRLDPANNIMTNLYGTVSTNGGASFAANTKISDVQFNPDNMKVGQGTHYYIGDYIGNSPIKNTSYNVWMDGRNNDLGSYVGFNPDFAMTVNPASRNLGNNDSAIITVKVPDVRAPYTDRVRFTASIDTLPLSGSITLTFVNGRDSLTSYPDSVYLRVRTIGNVTPRLYVLTIEGRGSNGVPVHRRVVNLLVNSSYLVIGTNREGIAQFKVNGVSYYTTQTLVFPNSSVVTVQAVSPRTIGANRYVYLSWSDNGDTTHNVTITNNMTLTAFYKIQFRLTISSSIGHTFGGGIYYDSAQTFIFGPTSLFVDTLGARYRFRGWDGAGNGSYTSPDSTGNDSIVSWFMSTPIFETARWQNLIGIENLGSEIPKEYKLYQNFPNPFNPFTTIKFDIIKSENVKVTLYDLLGREVKMLVNEFAKPGKYIITFNFDNLASGVYYYKIVSGEFVDTKKLVILK